MLNFSDELCEKKRNHQQYTLPSRKPIVGREEELAFLMGHYEAAENGFSHVVIVSGEAGIGKTCLVNEIAARAGRNGATILHGNCSDAEGMPLYLPFVEALGQYLHERSPDQLKKQVTPTTYVLASILPEIAALSDILPAPHPLPPEQAHFRLHKAIGEFLENIASMQSLVLVLDDLQWADSASLELLCSIMHQQTKAPLLILGTYRDGKINQNVALERTLAELTHQRVLTRLSLHSLTLQEIGALAASILGNSVSPDLCSRLHDQSEGNPFFAEELLQSWVEVEAIAQRNKQWIVSNVHGCTLPPNIIGALRQHFMQLSPQNIDYLRMAAIIGRTFHLSLLATLAEQPLEAIEAGLLEAEHAGLVRPVQTEVFTFCHDKVRECLYAEVSISRRQRLHEAIGRELESQYDYERDKKTAQFTGLAFCSQRHEPGRRSLLPASQAPQRALATQIASHYRAALKLFPKEDQGRGYLLLRVGKAEFLAAREEEAVRAYEEGVVALSQVGDLKAAARAAHCLGLAHWRREHFADARVAMDHALHLLEDSPCAETVLVLLDLFSLLTFFLGYQMEGQAYAQRSLEIASLLEETHLATLIKHLVIGSQDISSQDLALITLKEKQALKLIQASGELLETGAWCFPLAMHYYWLGELSRSADIAAHQIALMEYAGHPLPCQWPTAYSWLAIVYASRGEWKQALQAVEHAHTIIDHLASPLPLDFLQQIQGFLAYQQEDDVTAESIFQMALKHQQRWPDEALAFSGPLGLVLARRGKWEEARSYMDEMKHLLSSFPVDALPTAQVAVCLALLAIALEDRQQFADLYTRLLIFQGQLYRFLVDRVLGLLAALLGDKEAAVKHLAAAEITAQREGLRPELARIYLAQANVAPVPDNPASASQVRQKLELALGLFKELGMTISYNECYQQLHAASSSIPVCPPEPQQLPAHLSQREASILKLVASGKSNNQIAQELGLSQKTIANHLTHIFNKTGCDNRAAATAFALRQHLV